MGSVNYGKNRKKKPVEVALLSPTGARIVVSEERSQTLLSRAPYTLPDGTSVSYELDDSDEPTSVEVSEAKVAERSDKREERK
jgi:hypothetical protein